MYKFFKDYSELLKENGKFYKNHWKGCIVLLMASFAIGAAGYTISLVDWSDVRDTICEKLHK